MGVQKKTRKFAQVKRVIGQRDARLKKNQVTGESDQPKKPAEEVVRDMCVVSFSSLFSSPFSLSAQ
jgi:U3 small nucleolar RNA-associated protein 24